MLNHFVSGLRDRIKWFSAPRMLRVPMIKVIDSIQDEPGHIQILSVAMAFYALCKGTGLDYIEVIRQIERMETHMDAPYANQFKAMMAYAEGELNA